MRKVFAGCSVCVLSVLVAACGSSATPGTAGEGAPVVRAARPLQAVAAPPGRWQEFAPAVRLLELNGADSDEIADVRLKHGLVEVFRFVDGSDKQESASAVFSGDGLEQFLGKKVKSADGCSLYDVLTVQGNGGSAGVITVVNKSDTETLTPSGTSPHVVYAEASFASLAGSVSISAPGGANVGAFSGSANFPGSIQGFTAPTSLSRSTAWDVAWTKGSSSHMAIYVFGLDEVDGAVASEKVLRCQTKDSGAFTVTAAALALFPMTINEAGVALERTNEVVEKPTGWAVNLDVQQIIESAAFPFGP